MKVTPTNIEGIVIIEPETIQEDGICTYESFSQKEFDEKVRPVHFGQDNESMSTYGVLRGLHFQAPPFAHGFAVLSDAAICQYKYDNFYAPQAEGGISILDNSLGIDWQIPADKVILSEKDTKHPLQKDFDSPFSVDVDLYEEK